MLARMKFEGSENAIELWEPEGARCEFTGVHFILTSTTATAPP